MIIERDRIRSRLDSQTDGAAGATDLVTGDSPRGWRATDFQFELAFAFAGALVTPSNYDAIEVTISDAKDRRRHYIEKTVGADEINVDLTEAQWTAGTHQHVIVPLTAAETLLDMGGEVEREFFLVVIGITASGNRVPLGTAKFILEDDGTSGYDSTPLLGGTIVPPGQTYSGGGTYALPVTDGRIYYWIKGASDTSISNGIETITSNGFIVAVGATLAMVGTASAAITASVRWPNVFTAEQVTAKVAGLAKIINLPGVTSGWVSENGQFLRIFGVDDEGDRIDKVRDLTL